MTPGARVQAAIECLDQVVAGQPAERVLTRWARFSRYAGSKDRAAVRDLVFDALRQLRSAAWAGGAGGGDLPDLSGRAIMLGLLRNQGADTDALFSGQGHAPRPVSEPSPDAAPPRAVALDCPDWMLPHFDAALSDTTTEILSHMRHRAPIGLRTNMRLGGREALLAHLQDQGFDAKPHPLSAAAIVVHGAPRGLDRLDAFTRGWFEFQDPGAQAIVDNLPLSPSDRVLDLCAGGGGKALALAAAEAAGVFAHDASPDRMSDLAQRAARAQVVITPLAQPEDHAPFDAVVADVPCSGSGAWRRTPEAKWRLTPARLAELQGIQAAILDRAVALTRPGGWIGYMTCSLFDGENRDQVDAACARHPSLDLVAQMRLTPLDACDGFYGATFRKS